MTRVALVSGGSRGIGAAISKALQAAGYKVAANYAGNDAAAAKFKEETGIPVYKWDVSSYEQCVEGLQKISEDLGPIEILVNNAGITRDTTLHKMTSEQWSDVINTNLNSLFNMTRPVIEGMRERGFGRIVNIPFLPRFWKSRSCHSFRWVGWANRKKSPDAWFFSSPRNPVSSPGRRADRQWRTIYDLS
jgi:NAD(P)-dependent dehydrogenase (short-subunit alcohol dehydrogenase family)